MSVYSLTGRQRREETDSPSHGASAAEYRQEGFHQSTESRNTSDSQGRMLVDLVDPRATHGDIHTYWSEDFGTEARRNLELVCLKGIWKRRSLPCKPDPRDGWRQILTDRSKLTSLLVLVVQLRLYDS